MFLRINHQMSRETEGHLDNTENGMNKAITLLQLIINVEREGLCAFEILNNALLNSQRVK